MACVCESCVIFPASNFGEGEEDALLISLPSPIMFPLSPFLVAASKLGDVGGELGESLVMVGWWLEGGGGENNSQMTKHAVRGSTEDDDCTPQLHACPT